MFIAFGVATLVFVPLVLISVLVLDGGFLAVCICSTVHLFMRFAVARLCVGCKAAFAEANKEGGFFKRETI